MPPAPQGRQGRRRPRGGISVMASSSGWRQTARAWRVHAGRSSNDRILWCAREICPGMGRWPPPITPAAEMGWDAEGAGRDQHPMAAGEPRHVVDARRLQGFPHQQIRSEGGQPPRQPRRARSRRSSSSHGEPCPRVPGSSPLAPPIPERLGVAQVIARPTCAWPSLSRAADRCCERP